MEGESAEFLDWDMLHDSDSVTINSETDLLNSPDSGEILRDFEGIEGDSEGIIRSDYFSIDFDERYGKVVGMGDVGDESSVKSDNPSWIDPGSETRYGRKNSGEFWSDSSSCRSDESKFGEFEGKSGLGVGESMQSRVGYEGIGELKDGDENLGMVGSDYGKVTDLGDKNNVGFEENVKSQLGFESYGEVHAQMEDSIKFWADSSGDGVVAMKYGDTGKGCEMGLGDHSKPEDELQLPNKVGCGDGLTMESDGENGKLSENENHTTKEMELVAKSGSEEEKRRVVWWKVPLELLKYCAFRASPIWSFPVAAAVMGFIILGRRLYKMKQKSRNLELKVTMDDKKVSQFMSRATRLNEAFSVVRRVPMIRPSLPAAGLTPWPVMSMR